MATVPPALVRTEIDGVPTFWVDAPTPFIATLAFRVGRADETLARGGLTHLVEHLAVPIDHPHGIDANATVLPSWTMFYASGPPESVGEFITAVAGNLAALPADRFDTERRILLTEAAGGGPGPLGLAFMLRFGARGYGLVGHFEYGLHGLSAEDATTWAAERFVRENAVAWLSGPPPDSLRLPLASGGARIATPEPAPIPYLRFPCIYDRAHTDVLLTSVAERSTTLVLAVDIAERRLRRRLRHEGGLSYRIEVFYEPLTAELAHIAVVADALEGAEADVRDATSQTLWELARDGPDADELAREVEEARRFVLDPHNAPAAAYHAALGELLGAPAPTPDELLAEYAETTTDTVREALSAALDSALLLVPGGDGGNVPRFEPYVFTSPRPLEGKLHATRGFRMRRDPDEVQLVVGSEGIGTIWRDERAVVRFDECEAVLRWADGTRALWSADGFYVEVQPDAWRGGENIVASIDERTPPELWVRMERDKEERADAVGEAAEGRVKRNWLTGQELAALPDVLRRGEEIELVSRGDRGMSIGVLALTSERLLWLVFDEVKLELRRDEIDHVETKRKGLFSDNRLIVRAGGESYRFSQLHAQALPAFEDALSRR